MDNNTCSLCCIILITGEKKYICNCKINFILCTECFRKQFNCTYCSKLLLEKTVVKDLTGMNNGRYCKPNVLNDYNNYNNYLNTNTFKNYNLANYNFDNTLLDFNQQISSTPYYDISSFTHEEDTHEICSNCKISSQNFTKYKCNKCFNYICIKCYDSSMPYCLGCRENVHKCTECNTIIQNGQLFRCGSCEVENRKYFCSICSYNYKCELCNNYINSRNQYHCQRCKIRTNKMNGYLYICSCNSIHIKVVCYPKLFLCKSCSIADVKCLNCDKIFNKINRIEIRRGIFVSEELYTKSMYYYGDFK